MLVRGLDLSHHQATVDFGRMARDGVSFVMLKATEGAAYTDPTFADRAQQAAAAGLTVGAYHFGRPGSDVLAQVAHFLEVARPSAANPRLLVLDAEVLDGTSPAHAGLWCAAYVRLLARETGFRPWLYVNRSFADQTGLGRLAAGDVNLWVASWTTRATPTLPSGFATWQMWQYTNSGNVAGISPVDCNLAHADYLA